MSDIPGGSGQPLLPYEWPGSYVLDHEELAAARRVLEARSLFRYYGHELLHYVDDFEAAYRKRLGRKHALAVNSGTSALSIAMTALDIGPGDEVLLPGYLWVSCASAIVRAGAIPRLVDIDDTFVMDPEDLEKKIGPRSRAVLVIHMSGGTGELERIADIASAHGLPLIEDVAQANGGSFRGRPLGSFGDIAIFSFQYNKAITAGEGGLIAMDDDELYDRAVAVHDLGYPRDEDGRLVTDDATKQMWGQGSRLSELSAAILTVQERKLDRIVEAMRSHSRRLYEGLDGVGGATRRRSPDPSGENGAFVILTWPDADTCRQMIADTRDAGVRTGPHGINNITFEAWGLHLYFNNASLVHKRVLRGRSG